MIKEKKCTHCDGEGRWEIATISTHDVYNYCDYCNGTGIENKKLAEKIKKEKEASWNQPSVYEELDRLGIHIC